MTDNQIESTKYWLRIISGVLAIVTMLLVVFRMLAIIQGNFLAGDDAFVHILRLIFPFSLSLLFGYVAWKGSLPFTG